MADFQPARKRTIGDFFATLLGGVRNGYYDPSGWAPYVSQQGWKERTQQEQLGEAQRGDVRRGLGAFERGMDFGGPIGTVRSQAEAAQVPVRLDAMGFPVRQEFTRAQTGQMKEATKGSRQSRKFAADQHVPQMSLLNEQVGNKPARDAMLQSQLRQQEIMDAMRAQEFAASMMYDLPAKQAESQASMAEWAPTIARTSAFSRFADPMSGMMPTSPTTSMIGKTLGFDMPQGPVGGGQDPRVAEALDRTTKALQGGGQRPASDRKGVTGIEDFGWGRMGRSTEAPPPPQGFPQLPNMSLEDSARMFQGSPNMWEQRKSVLPSQEAANFGNAARQFLSTNQPPVMDQPNFVLSPYLRYLQEAGPMEEAAVKSLPPEMLDNLSLEAIRQMIQQLLQQNR